MGNGTRRSFGTILMSVGLLMILSVGGYFAWNEVQAAQVRTELDSSAAAAAARATRVANELAQAKSVPDDPSQARLTATPASKATTGAAKSAGTARQSPVVPAPDTATSAPKPTAAAALAAAAIAANATEPPTSTTATAPRSTVAPPTSAPTAAPAPILPVRMQIPDLKIDTKVEEMGWTVTQTKSGPVSDWDIPKNDAGHTLNSASIGQPDNLVIVGHNNIYGKVFMPISQAWTNDGMVKVDAYTDKSNALTGREVILYDAAGNQYNYVITDFYRVRDSGVSAKQRQINGRFIQPTGDERVTIVTCWPPTNNTHRLLVIARPEK